MRLNKLGIVVEKYWKENLKHFRNIELDNFQIMPNHLHGIIIIKESRDVACNVPTNNISPQKGSLSVIIRSFKSACTKQIRRELNSTFSWQSRYFDRIIRNENELYEIRKYIGENPQKWEIENSTK